MNKTEEILKNILEMIQHLQTLVEINNKKIIKLEVKQIEKPVNMTTRDEILKNFYEKMKEQYNIISISRKLDELEILLSSNKIELQYSKDYIKTMINKPFSLTITDKVYIIQASRKLTYYEELVLKNEEEIKKLNEELQNEIKVFEPEFLKIQQEYLCVPE